MASVCLRKILFCPSVSCCQSVISSARRDPFNDDVVDISKYLKFIYFYIQLLLSSYGTISLELYRSNTDRFFPIFFILIFFWSRPAPIIHLNMGQPSDELILLFCLI